MSLHRLCGTSEGCSSDDMVAGRAVAGNDYSLDFQEVMVECCDYAFEKKQRGNRGLGAKESFV